MTELEQLIQLALKYKLKSIASAAGSVETTEATFKPEEPETIETTELTKDEMPSDDDMLMWSTGEALPSEIRTAENTGIKDNA